MTNTVPRTGYAPVNGLQMYYEIYGQGAPLVLIHGGLGMIALFADHLLPMLASTRQVIGVELQCHGHTADSDRPFSYEQFADDVAALITYLGVGPADVCGYSLGGGVALQTAIRHPDAVRKLVTISAPYRSDGWYPEVRAGMAAMVAAPMLASPLYQAYAAVAPQPASWSVLIAKTRRLLTGGEYDWSDQIRQTLAAPTLIVVGDADSVRTAHAVELFGLLGGGLRDGAVGGSPDTPGAMSGMVPSQLAILPGTTHFTIIERTDLLAAIIPPFLDAPLPGGK